MFPGAPSQPATAKNAAKFPHIIMGGDADIEQFPYQVVLLKYLFPQEPHPAIFF